MEEVSMPQRPQQQQNQPQAAAGGGNAKAEAMKAKLAEKMKANPKFRSMTDAEMSSYLEWENTRMKSISNQIVEYFP